MHQSSQPIGGFSAESRQQCAARDGFLLLLTFEFDSFIKSDILDRFLSACNIRFDVVAFKAWDKLSGLPLALQQFLLTTAVPAVLGAFQTPSSMSKLNCPILVLQKPGFLKSVY